MAQNRALTYIVSTAIVLGLLSWGFSFLFLSHLPSSTPSLSLGTLTEAQQKAEYLIHGPSNSIIPWKALSKETSQISHHRSVAIFAFGIALLAGFGGFALRSIIFIALSSALSLMLLYGNDPIILGIFSLAPLIALTVTRYLKSGATLWVLLFAYLALKNRAFAGPLFAHSIIISAVLAVLSTYCDMRFNKKASSSEAVSFRSAIIFLITTLLTLFTYYQTPQAPIFDYPANSVLLPDDGLPGIIRPLIGDDYFVPTIDQVWIKYALYQFSWIALITSLISLAVSLKKKGVLPSIIIAFFISSVLALDILTPNSLSVIAPLASVSRVLPGLSLFPLSLILPGLLLVTILYSTPRVTPRLSKLSLLTIFIPILTGALSHSHYIKNERYDEKVFSLHNAPLNSNSLQNLNSPSLWITLNYDRLRPLKDEELNRFVSPDISNCDLVNLKGDCTSLIDNNLNSRIRSLENKESALTVHFKAPVKISAIQISPGKFSSDYPNKLEIYSCIEGSNSLILSLPNWLGPVRSTTSGLSYIGAQSDVKLGFKEDITTDCLTVVQSKNNRFDWSIAELAILPTI